MYYYYYKRCSCCAAKKNIRLIRLSLQWTQKDAAYKIGISPRTLSRYEKKPETIPVELALKIAKTYNVDIDEICFI